MDLDIFLTHPRTLSPAITGEYHNHLKRVQSLNSENLTSICFSFETSE